MHYSMHPWLEIGGRLASSCLSCLWGFLPSMLSTRRYLVCTSPVGNSLFVNCYYAQCGMNLIFEVCNSVCNASGLIFRSEWTNPFQFLNPNLIWCCNNMGLLQIIFDNIMNREIPWPQVPEELSFEAYDLIDK